MKYLNELEENLSNKVIAFLYAKKSEYQEVLSREIDERDDYEAISDILEETIYATLKNYNLNRAMFQPSVFIADIVRGKIDENKIIEQVQKRLDREAGVGL